MRSKSGVLNKKEIIAKRKGVGIVMKKNTRVNKERKGQSEFWGRLW
jgi:hypothetical protein